MFLRSRAPGEIALVPPVVAEIEYGIQRLEGGTRKRVLLERELRRLLNSIRVLEWTKYLGRGRRDSEIRADYVKHRDYFWRLI
jgi:predicted nucleic acid-binding protein